MRILGTFDGHHTHQRMSDISRRAGLAIPTCHRLLGDLVAAGALQRTEDGHYSVGRSLWTIAMSAPLQRSIRDVAVPYMQDLLRATGQVVNLFVLEGDSVLVLERIGGTAVGPPVTIAGAHLPLHTSAGGKVLLAHSESDLLGRVLGNLFRETDRSITDPDILLRELEQVRRRGWAMSAGEHHPNSWGVSVPVRVVDDRVVAALGVVSFVPIKQPQPLISALQVVATAIGRQIRRQG
ncbi:MAG: IclR family transcriptional regulator [Propionibacteriaceae bacterium]|nr:IclR family transcriptional regulator [Propionibacteriaceae bacterium]